MALSFLFMNLLFDIEMLPVKVRLPTAYLPE